MTNSKRAVFNKVIILFILCLISSLFSLNSFSKELDNKNYIHNLQIISNNNDKVLSTFKVKIANKDSSREKGLMFIEKLPLNYGLLFVFEEEKIVRMWMKNTLIPLDMLFIDQEGKIVRIARSTKPLSRDIISSKYKVKSVLEINSDLAKKYKIRIGDKLKLLK